MTSADIKTRSVIEYGDYQTPNVFAADVCKKLIHHYELSPDVVLEPTFGTGNILHEALLAFPDVKNAYGIEINEDYYKIVTQAIMTTPLHKTDVELFNEDIFTFNFVDIKKSVSRKDSLLIVGNPPWATNSQLSAMDSSNLPLKSNFKGRSGLEAMTGGGNFDIAEYIILKLLSEFADYNCTLAMLCKTAVAKNMIRYIDKYVFSMASMDMFSFGASEVFGVNCDACLLVARLGKPSAKTCAVYDFYSGKKLREIGWAGDMFCSDVQRLRAIDNIDGKCQLEWRQGIKHDCSKVMELSPIDRSLFRNGHGEVHSLQVGRYVYPLVKSSDIKSYRITQTRKYVIVPQRYVNEDTSPIQYDDPSVWAYLQKHEQYFATRRSSIYKNAPKFSIFGIGEYSFSKYKVGISGFYKKPIFALVEGEVPIMMDDTCYFLSFDSMHSAVITLALLNSPKCLDFLESIAFLDSKRPYTKEILQRIDLLKLSNLVEFDYIHTFSANVCKELSIQQTDFDSYRRALAPSAPNQLIPDSCYS
jgi:hypothetical protein